jgi:hypothetical protein
MQLVSQPDIVGPATQRLVATPGTKARVIFATATGNSTGATIGDANVGAAQGFHLASGAPFGLYADPDDMTARWDLYETWAYVPSGVTLTWSYGS